MFALLSLPHRLFLTTIACVLRLVLICLFVSHPQQPLPVIVLFALFSLYLVVMPMTEGVDFSLLYTFAFLVVSVVVFVVFKCTKDRCRCCGEILFLRISGTITYRNLVKLRRRRKGVGMGREKYARRPLKKRWLERAMFYSYVLFLPDDCFSRTVLIFLKATCKFLFLFCYY